MKHILVWMLVLVAAMAIGRTLVVSDTLSLQLASTTSSEDDGGSDSGPTEFA